MNLLKPAVAILVSLIVGFLMGRYMGNAHDESNMVYLSYKGGQIKGKEVLEKIQPDVDQLARNLYEMKKRTTQELAVQKLLEAEAKNQNLSVDQLKEKLRNDAKATAVTNEDLNHFLAQRQLDPKKMSKKELDSAAGNLRILKASEVQKNFTEELWAKAEVKWSIPRPPHKKVSAGKGSIEKQGSWNSPVTIVVFSNFNCPFCNLGSQRLNELKTKYPDKLAIHYRFAMQEPEDSIVFKSAEAAYCANDQSKFWSFHDLILQAPASDEVMLSTYAQKVGMNQSTFDECMKNRKHKAAVLADIAEAQKVGVFMIPSFVINDQLVSGTPSMENLSEIIDQEL